ncbi:hypothetical protein [Dissulfurispira sp.]|uniref:hypothetical protein n=1 Tax=Dissulfurispira sp. TaxID=2817609 RepID=UPI002FDAF08E
MAVPAQTASADLKPTFLYNLSSFTGPVHFDWVRVAADEERNEIYVVSEGIIRVFNERGMEIYRFGDNADFGAIYDVAVTKDGDIIILSYRNSRYSLIRCNFRGEPVGTLEIKNLPPELSGFSPNRIIHKTGQFYFASLGAMRVVVTDMEGNFKDSYDLAALSGIKENERADTGIVGFNVDSEGNILYTIPVIAKAYALSPDKKVREFGKRGSAPGKFGVPGDILKDRSGNYYLVADTLRCVVLIFDKDFRFITEFGFRGLRPGNLIGPRNLAIDGKGLLYVTQLRHRGVSVFRITERDLLYQ